MKASYDTWGMNACTDERTSTAEKKSSAASAGVDSRNIFPSKRKAASANRIRSRAHGRKSMTG